jgi:hypothetical protein
VTAETLKMLLLLAMTTPQRQTHAMSWAQLEGKRLGKPREPCRAAQSSLEAERSADVARPEKKTYSHKPPRH